MNAYDEVTVLPGTYSFSNDGDVIDYWLKEGLSMIVVGVSKPDKFGRRHPKPQWCGAVDQPAEVDLRAIDMMGGMDKFPWPLRKVGEDVYRLRITVVRDDASLYGLYYEIRHRLKHWWRIFRKKCEYTCQIWRR